MAADGAWPRGADPEPRGPDDDRTRRAVAQLHAILGDVEGRLAAPGPAPLPPDAMVALAEALETLAWRVSQREHDAAGRHAALGATLDALAQRLEIRVDRGAAPQVDASADLAPAAAARTAVVAATDPASIRLIFGAASTAAALSVLGACALVLAHPGALPQAIASPPTDLPLRPGPMPARPAVAGRLATALPAAAAPTAPARDAVRDTYEAATAALARGEATALPRLTGLAQGGDAKAQLALAGLYESGGAGTPRDLGAARGWTRRAAEGGDRIAMHNLAIFLVNGEGGARDDGEAAVWFRRAAERGVVDSQHDLGLLYESGRGVERNLREAYRWFTVAANAGDTASREKQLELEARLRPAERSALDRDASGYQPGASPPTELAMVIPPAATLSETQALLARKGYYVGPVDGVSSAALTTAAAAYLHDHPGVTASAP
ncbi:tetratricopeptide repeat protein [Phenylobacterium sp.]|uniref:tetratricopeptide repeat protein n=1 Tax=Phenylobacterium sp. TaxID=1871053 RepID=UPI0025F2F647|nr:tetratricopeptide repeat protein [Phenylobacterium sp.]